MNEDSSPTDDTVEQAESTTQPVEDAEPVEAESATQPAEDTDTSEFANEASQQSVGIVREFWDFLLYNKKWWLLPILLVLLLVAGLVLLTNSPVAPFIYTLF